MKAESGYDKKDDNVPEEVRPTEHSPLNDLSDIFCNNESVKDKIV